jgi:phospholipid/cholesterol/gamma-HCH transport system substrate-binding protein
VGSAVDRLNEVIADNREPLKETMASLNKFSAALAENSDRVSRIMEGLDKLANGPDTQGAITDIRNAAQQIRTLAENLDKRTAELSAGLGKFTGPGLREIEAFAAEGRRTLAGIDRAVRNFDRNPQRLIFGGSGGSVPEYNGRR